MGSSMSDPTDLAASDGGNQCNKSSGSSDDDPEDRDPSANESTGAASDKKQAKRPKKAGEDKQQMKFIAKLSLDDVVVDPARPHEPDTCRGQGTTTIQSIGGMDVNKLSPTVLWSFCHKVCGLEVEAKTKSKIELLCLIERLIKPNTKKKPPQQQKSRRSSPPPQVSKKRKTTATTTTASHSPSGSGTKASPAPKVQVEEELELLYANQRLLNAIANFDYETYDRLVADDVSCMEPESNHQPVIGKAFHKYYFDRAAAARAAGAEAVGGGSSRKRKAPPSTIHSSDSDSSSNHINVTMVNPHVQWMQRGGGAILSYVKLVQRPSPEPDGPPVTIQQSETRVWEMQLGKSGYRRWVNVHFHKSPYT